MSGILHDVLKLTIRSGEVYAVHLAGAQLGWHNPIATWKEFADTKIYEILESMPSLKPRELLKTAGYSHARERKTTYNSNTVPNIETPVHMVLYMMGGCALEWQYDEKPSLKEMWTLPENSFLVKRDDFDNFVEWKLQETGPSTMFTINGKRLVAQVGAPNDMRVRCRYGEEPSTHPAREK
jgi:hypothetical protein